MYFDAHTGLLYRWDVVSESGGADKGAVTQFYADEYKDINRIKVLAAIHVVTPGITVTSRFIDIKTNVPIDYGTFSKPSDPLVGNWKGSSPGGDKKYEAQFLADGRVFFRTIIGKNVISTNGTWTRTGNAVVIEEEWQPAKERSVLTPLLMETGWKAVPSKESTSSPCRKCSDQRAAG